MTEQKIKESDNSILDKNYKLLKPSETLKSFSKVRKEQTSKQFFIDPVLSFFKKRKNKINFFGYIVLMVNIFTVMKFTKHTETVWKVKSIGLFYMLLYLADCVGASVSLIIYNNIDKKVLNFIQAFLMLATEIMGVVLSSLGKLDYRLEIPILGNIILPTLSVLIWILTLNLLIMKLLYGHFIPFPSFTC